MVVLTVTNRKAWLLNGIMQFKKYYAQTSRLKRLIEAYSRMLLNNEIDYRKLIEYSIKTKNKSLIKRIGYILEEEGYNARELIRYLDSNYVSLDFDREPKGKQNKKWKIIVNRSSNDIY